MKQTLILLAGYPGTGKSYLAELLMKQFTGFEILSPDEIKEEFWDAYGFRNEQEKEELIQKSWVEYYHRMEWKFTRGSVFSAIIRSAINSIISCRRSVISIMYRLLRFA